MHSTHQAKLLNVGYTIYTGTTTTNGLVIKAKTPDNHNWHTIEAGFKNKSQLKKRLFDLDKKSNWIDLYDSKNTITEYENIQMKEKAERWDTLHERINKMYFDENGNELPENEFDLADIGQEAAVAFGYL